MDTIKYWASMPFLVLLVVLIAVTMVVTGWKLDEEKDIDG